MNTFKNQTENQSKEYYTTVINQWHMLTHKIFICWKLFQDKIIDYMTVKNVSFGGFSKMILRNFRN